jgi:hypothetical protein
MFSGLNLAFFSVTKLRLEIESKRENPRAIKIARFRQDSNFLLTTILWGNVGINVLLTLLSHSVMAGIAAFLFSTVVITFFGEIIPQAYFSRYAMKVASFLSPAVRFYQILLYPVAKPSAVVLDKLLGPEAVRFFKEKEFRELLRIHMNSEETDIQKLEGRGALNFLAIDDLRVVKEGEIIEPDSIIQLQFDEDKPIFPQMARSTSDPFLKSLQSSKRKWVIIIDSNGEPRLTVNANSFVRSVLFDDPDFDPLLHCHHPVIVTDEHATLGKIIPKLEVQPQRAGDDVIDKDIILLWGSQKRIITGSDILGRLLRGIVQNQGIAFKKIVQKKN